MCTLTFDEGSFTRFMTKRKSCRKKSHDTESLFFWTDVTVLIWLSLLLSWLFSTRDFTSIESGTKFTLNITKFYDDEIERALLHRIWMIELVNFVTLVSGQQFYIYISLRHIHRKRIESWFDYMTYFLKVTWIYCHSICILKSTNYEFGKYFKISCRYTRLITPNKKRAQLFLIR